MALVRQNFAASLGINGVGVVAGALGVLSPFAAAVVHNLSTVAVVLNSGRLLAPDGAARGAVGQGEDGGGEDGRGDAAGA